MKNITKKNSMGTFEAKTNFNRLIQRVHDGEEFLITRRGNPVAKIIPLEKDTNRISTSNAVNRIKKLAQEMHLGKFDWDEWRLYKDDGKK